MGHAKSVINPQMLRFGCRAFADPKRVPLSAVGRTTVTAWRLERTSRTAVHESCTLLSRRVLSIAMRR